MNVYLVGGAVRDTLLGIPFTERDWVVTGATPEQMLAEGYRYKDPDGAFPVFLHPGTGEEYALARRETKTGAGYRGFAIDAGADVTLEEDLARRDLTINAMAQDVAGNLIDPFGGRDDLDAGLLRHVTPAFTEDPVRLLRIARFAAKLGQYGFRVAHGTHALMKRMAVDADLKALQPARVWAEWRRALAEAQPWRFIEVLQRCDALPQVLPELADALGEAAGHGDRQTSVPIAALKQAVAEDLPTPWRMACLLATLPGDVDALVARLPVDKAHAAPVRLLRTLLPAYRALQDAGAEAWLAFLEAGRAWRDADAFEWLARACRLCAPEAPGEVLDRLLLARTTAAAVDAGELKAGGLDGAALGQALKQARLAAVAEACGRPV